jgi:hypothetical protein
MWFVDCELELARVQEQKERAQQARTVVLMREFGLKFPGRNDYVYVGVQTMT